MDADDFQDLYKLLRGSRCAVAVLDARALFVERKMADALLKMTEARASFAESRHRVLRQDPEKTVDSKAKDRDRQIKKIKRKQEKAQETLDAFDEILPVLTKFSERQAMRQTGAQPSDASLRATKVIDEASQGSSDAGSSDAGSSDAGSSDAGSSDAGSSDAGLDSYSDFDSIDDGTLAENSQDVYSAGASGPQRPACAADFTPEFMKKFGGCRGEEKLDLIGKHFGFRPVDNELDVYGDGVYLIRTKKRTMLVSLPLEFCETDELRLLNLVDKKRIKPVTRVAFLDLGARRKMVLLTCPQSDGRGPLAFVEDPGIGKTNEEASSDTGEMMVDHGTAMNDPGTVVDD